MAAFSKYIIYADESGSPHLGADGKDFPIFVLNFLFVEKAIYTAQVQPAPYDIALGICMEMAANRLCDAGEDGTTVHVVFEARGAKEDQLLELEFRRIAGGSAKVSFGSDTVQRFKWVPVFATKASNSAGLQIADLAARPLGLAHLRPQQPNRAWSAMRITSARSGPKIYP